MTPANDNRPAEFDAKLLAYLPGLRGLARRLRPSSSDDVREEMVQDALTYALSHWRAYRTENSIYTWLVFIMRTISADGLRKERKTHEFKLRVAGVSTNVTEPNQEHATDLALTIGRISPGIRDDLVAVACGDLLAEAGARRGVTRQRVEQVIKVERERLLSLERRADTRRAVAYGRVV